MNDVKHTTTRRAQDGLPARLKPLFWEYDFRQLSWPADRDLVIDRVLSAGRWADVKWLRARVSDDELRAWIRQRRGRNLTPQQICFWQVILDLPRRETNAWLAARERQIWDGRLNP